MKLTLESSRHLTGPNLFFHLPGTVLDVAVEGVPVEEIVQCWQEEVQKLLAAVGWEKRPLTVRTSPEGASLAFCSSMDTVYAATELNEAAWISTVALFSGTTPENFEKTVAKLKASFEQESNPELLKLSDAADSHGLQLLADKETVTLGLGVGSISWPADKLPAADEVDWNSLRNIPLALITGTNGKSTVGCLLASIVNADGKTPGLTSTDWIKVGDEILDVGDYSGPGGAREILRDQRVEFGVLESARGGMMRRGLGVTEAQAGIITNVAEEHLGEYGVRSLADLIDVKFTILRPLELSGGTLVLNADDSGLVEYSKKLKHPLCWFSLDANSPILLKHRKEGGSVCYADLGKIFYAQGNSVNFLLNVNEIPFTLNGAARYNVANSLGVIALAKNLGFADEIIVKTLKEFKGDIDDNPGRGNYLTLPLPTANRSQDSDVEQAFQLLIDFAHNAHGLNAVCETLALLPVNQRLVVAGHVGSHSDQEIREMTRVIAEIKPIFFLVPQMEDYLRGRKPGEISKIVLDELRLLGFAEENIGSAENCLEAVKLAVQRVKAGDLLMLIGLDKRDEILAFLEELKN
ncbi:MAG: Mur ligase family protein [SAR324 cluster bacterium]|nr:Mur ligase family protein [SAR324 cluster bacterium]